MIYEIEGRYRIQPYSNGLCWEVYEYKPVKSRKDDSEALKWVHTGKYPTTFGYALKIVYELMMKDGNETIRGFKSAIKHADEIKQKLMNYQEKEG